jgi:hypothetical protein
LPAIFDEAVSAFYGVLAKYSLADFIMQRELAPG